MKKLIYICVALIACIFVACFGFSRSSWWAEATGFSAVLSSIFLFFALVMTLHDVSGTFK